MRHSSRAGQGSQRDVDSGELSACGGDQRGAGDGAVCCYLTLPCCAGKGSKGYLSGRVKGGSVAVVTNTRATGDVVRELVGRDKHETTLDAARQ